MDENTDVIELENMNTFIEYYREYRDDGVSTHKLKIQTTEIIIPANPNPNINMKDMQKRNMVRTITDEFLNAIIEFPDDMFHIQLKCRESVNDGGVFCGDVGIRNTLVVTLYIFLVPKMS